MYSNVCLSGSSQERASGSDTVQGYHVDSAVHQKLLPVGEHSEEPASLPGEVQSAYQRTICISLCYLQAAEDNRSLASPYLNSPNANFNQCGGGLSRKHRLGPGSVLEWRLSVLCLCGCRFKPQLERVESQWS